MNSTTAVFDLFVQLAFFGVVGYAIFLAIMLLAISSQLGQIARKLDKLNTPKMLPPPRIAEVQ
jgi:hypothetical protein